MEDTSKQKEEFNIFSEVFLCANGYYFNRLFPLKPYSYCGHLDPP
jgi:hypothetical protein